MHNSKKEFEHYLKRSVQVYFVLNKLDRLVGFQHFSKHLDEEHRKQLLSFSSDKEESNEWLNDVCNQIKMQINNFRE